MKKLIETTGTADPDALPGAQPNAAPDAAVPNERDAIEDAAAGELPRAGFADEALPWLDAVYRFSLRLTAGNRVEADDVVQETFLRAYRHWDTFRRGTSARAWLFTIARNVFLRSRERLARKPETLVSELDYDVAEVSAEDALRDIGEQDPERKFFASFIDEEVTRAVERLPPEFREVVVLSDIEGLNYAEIADVVGVPLGTVKSRLYRGRRQLQRSLYEYAVEMGYLSGRTE
ncbi:MAG TPA: sigma-70 family RNA polymerase sigma factor [Longimicrobiales bacterium]|nr:sigma-70 family RNA polymerase sigma factor [Longimicrobiales bacterium]